MHHYADVSSIQWHYVAAGTGKLILFLHGFPEFWYAWKQQLAEFGRDFQAVAPALRGYNQSSRSSEVEQYTIPLLVEDVRALIAHLGHRRCVPASIRASRVVAKRSRRPRSRTRPKIRSASFGTTYWLQCHAPTATAVPHANLQAYSHSRPTQRLCRVGRMVRTGKLCRTYRWRSFAAFHARCDRRLRGLCLV